MQGQICVPSPPPRLTAAASRSLPFLPRGPFPVPACLLSKQKVSRRHLRASGRVVKEACGSARRCHRRARASRGPSPTCQTFSHPPLRTQKLLLPRSNPLRRHCLPVLRQAGRHSWRGGLEAGTVLPPPALRPSRLPQARPIAQPACSPSPVPRRRRGASPPVLLMPHVARASLELAAGASLGRGEVQPPTREGRKEGAQGRRRETNTVRIWKGFQFLCLGETAWKTSSELRPLAASICLASSTSSQASPESSSKSFCRLTP